MKDNPTFLTRNDNNRIPTFTDFSHMMKYRQSVY
jgi:hypothetical protein